MVSVSLCMIVKNEEDVLERCLESVSGLVDEIIVVDTGSTDNTKEAAARFTDRILISRGRTILQLPEMKPFPMPLWITVCGWMRMTYFWKQIRPHFWL